MEAVRNYVQHKSIPISLFFTNDYTPHKDIKIVHGCVSPYFEVRDLDDRSFKRSIFKEIGQDKIFIKPHIDQYVSCIHNIHFIFRELVQSDRTQAITNLSDILTKFEKLNDIKTDYLSFIKCYESSGDILQNEYLVRDMIERNKHLEKRVHINMNFTTHSATTFDRKLS